MIILSYRHHTFIVSDWPGIVKYLFSFRSLTCRSNQIDFTVFKHLLHLTPTLVITDIFIIDIPITSHQTKGIITIPTSIPVFILHMVSIHLKESHTHCLSLWYFISCIHNLWTHCNNTKECHKYCNIFFPVFYSHRAPLSCLYQLCFSLLSPYSLVYFCKKTHLINR